MPTYYDSKGNALDLSERIGSGGEGTVFVYPLDRTLVAKIYHEPITDEKAEKLRWMAGNNNEQLLKIAAWVVDVLTDAPDGKVVGFLMPHVRAKEIHELYSLKSRRVHFPDATWTFLVHAAGNLARAFYNLHKSDHIMGDINQGNCVVLADGTVKLIDCDSYSINDGARRHPCEVGVGTHLAPELQGTSLRGVLREKKHDNFGLAVIIFQLLFLGRHPFAGNYLGKDDISIEDAIRQLRFAYGNETHIRGVKQPPGTLSLSAMPPRISLMFERAFLTEDRPEPREWIEALEDLKENLKQCAMHPGHHYFQELFACPWCELETKTGLMLFPFTGGNQTLEGEETFNIFTIENLLTQIVPSKELALRKPSLPTLIPFIEPEENVEIERREMNRFTIIFAVIQFILIIFLSFGAGSGIAFFVGLISMTAGLIYLVNNHKSLREELESEVEARREDWNKLANEWEKISSGNIWEKDVETIRGKVSDYHELQKDSRVKIKLLQDEAHRYQLEKHLSNFAIADAKISGLKPLTLTDLRINGIKTAADVDSKHLKTIDKIDGYLTTQLLNWRSSLERNFEYQPNVQLPESSHQRVVKEFNEKRRKIEKDIEKMLTVLRMGAGSINQKQQQILAQTEKLEKDFLQAEANLKAIGSNAGAVFGLVFITGISLVFGNALLTAPPKSQISNSITSTGIAPPAPKAKEENEIEVAENLTDEQISAMTDWEKKASAETLSKQARRYADLYNPSDSDRKIAEKKLRLAVRISPKNVEIHNQLGSIVYDQERFKEALEIFNKSANLEPNNIETETYIGMTYLKLKQFANAKNTFISLTKNAPNSSVVYFNLGLAYEGLSKYEKALEAFEKADEIQPNDAETTYAVGRCYYYLDAFQNAELQYGELQKLNPQLALYLRNLLDNRKTDSKTVIDGKAQGIGRSEPKTTSSK
ncbi:MAG TPA: tetratricopeptide repeat protein [Pyrinomonadaceae bacterium]|nr:tetratricopeptide repeat protein [Pyrinomonadaceae bacterium]